MTKMEAVADTDMVKNAVGDDYDVLAEPPMAQEDGNFPLNDPLWPLVRAALKEIYDPD